MRFCELEREGRKKEGTGMRKKRRCYAVSTLTVLLIHDIVATILFRVGEAPSALVWMGWIERQSAGLYLNTHVNGLLLSGDIHGTVAITVERYRSIGGHDGMV